MKDTIPLTQVVPFLWRRLVCVFKDHETMSLVKWAPDEICMHFVCGRCGKELGHMHLPATKNSKKEILH